MDVKAIVPLRTSVYREPKKAAQGITKTDCGGADGWQPKSLRNSIWQGKPACWVGTWSPTTVAQVPVTSRDMVTVGWKFNETSTLNIGLGQSPVHAGVTVVPAPSGKRRKWCGISTTGTMTCQGETSPSSWRKHFSNHLIGVVWSISVTVFARWLQHHQKLCPSLRSCSNTSVCATCSDARVGSEDLRHASVRVYKVPARRHGMRYSVHALVRATHDGGLHLLIGFVVQNVFHMG